MMSLGVVSRRCLDVVCSGRAAPIIVDVELAAASVTSPTGTTVTDVCEPVVMLFCLDVRVLSVAVAGVAAAAEVVSFIVKVRDVMLLPLTVNN